MSSQHFLQHEFLVVDAGEGECLWPPQEERPTMTESAISEASGILVSLAHFAKDLVVAHKDISKSHAQNSPNSNHCVLPSILFLSSVCLS